mmetsp:Transcript_37375/g.68909  ORF Transcript_37375/g.68909 Transcript_37375/m.68909 type:complete len:115 (-) Transcript_37375:554-898(-)
MGNEGASEAAAMRAKCTYSSARRATMKLRHLLAWLSLSYATRASSLLLAQSRAGTCHYCTANKTGSFQPYVIAPVCIASSLFVDIASCVKTCRLSSHIVAQAAMNSKLAVLKLA